MPLRPIIPIYKSFSDGKTPMPIKVDITGILNFSANLITSPEAFIAPPPTSISGFSACFIISLSLLISFSYVFSFSALFI